SASSGVLLRRPGHRGPFKSRAFWTMDAGKATPRERRREVLEARGYACIHSAISPPATRKAPRKPALFSRGSRARDGFLTPRTSRLQNLRPTLCDDGKSEHRFGKSRRSAVSPIARRFTIAARCGNVRGIRDSHAADHAISGSPRHE